MQSSVPDGSSQGFSRGSARRDRDDDCGTNTLSIMPGTNTKGGFTYRVVALARTRIDAELEENSPSLHRNLPFCPCTLRTACERAREGHKTLLCPSFSLPFAEGCL